MFFIGTNTKMYINLKLYVSFIIIPVTLHLAIVRCMPQKMNLRNDGCLEIASLKVKNWKIEMTELRVGIKEPPTLL